MRKVALCVVAMSVMLVGALPAVAGDDAQPTVQTHLKRVALFKNGFGFFVREGALSEAQRAVLLGPFAAPAHGTFWLSTPSRAQLASVIARQVMVSRKIEARTTYELLRANVGKSVVLGEYGGGLVGTILSFASDRPPIPGPDPYAMGVGSREGDSFPPGPGEFMLLDTPAGIVAVGAGGYGQVRFMSRDLNTTLLVDDPQVQLEAVLSAPTRGDWLSVSYLARGITWAPSYLIDITDPKQARLSAKAEIINEGEDLDGTHVDLVTGFPNLEFADVLSPMSMKTNLAQFLQSLAAGPTRLDMSIMTQNVAGYAEAPRGGRGGGGAMGGFSMPGYGAAAAGQVAEDLFLYPIENVTLKKNETGYYPLFTEAVPYTEFYEWQIGDYLNPEGYYAPQRGDQEPQREIVWHSIRLTNTMEMPWTTAPAQLMKDGQIIGQDTLKYTAPTSKGTVRITQAVGVKAEQTEVEVNREREAIRLYGDSFDRVTITGTLRATNYTKEPISLEVAKELSGDVKETVPKAEDVTLARGLKAMNPAHELTWKIELKPGDGKEITYTYQALIRR
jgi:hypothetical protein